MRIALVYHQFVPRGGLEGYLMEFAFRLRKEGHDVLAVTAEADPRVEKELGVKVRRIPLARGSALVRMWQFERQAARLDKAALGVDVVLGFGRTTTHDVHRAGGGCHRLYAEMLPWWKRLGLKNLLELQLERELYTGRRTRRFVVNSAQVAAQLHAAYGTPAESFRVIHTAVDTAKFKPAADRAELRKTLCGQIGADVARPLCLFVSLSHWRKGLDALLEAWTEVDADLWIVGKPLDARYRALVARFGLGGRVFAMGARAEIGPLYQAADWFVHPTRYDACANTVLQSMACGLPGLVSVHDGATDVLKHGDNGWLLERPQEAGALAAAVKRALACGEPERLAMGMRARETMLPLTWGAHLQKWQDVMEELDDRERSAGL